MKKLTFVIVVGLTVSALLTGYTVVSLKETNEQKEGTYLPIANSIIASEVQDIEQYGSFYIDRSDGMKFVVALAQKDSKTELLIEKMKKEIPEDLLVINTDYKYPVAELKKVMAEITVQLSKLVQTTENDVVSVYLDEPTDSVIVEARSLSNEWITEWENKYQDKVTVHIDPNLQNPVKVAE